MGHTHPGTDSGAGCCPVGLHHTRRTTLPRIRPPSSRPHQGAGGGFLPASPTTEHSPASVTTITRSTPWLTAPVARSRPRLGADDNYVTDARRPRCTRTPRSSLRARRRPTPARDRAGLCCHHGIDCLRHGGSGARRRTVRRRSRRTRPISPTPPPPVPIGLNTAATVGARAHPRPQAVRPHRHDHRRAANSSATGNGTAPAPRGWRHRRGRHLLHRHRGHERRVAVADTHRGR